MFKTGIYVDAENIRLSGGCGMRYDILVDLANAGNSELLRANSYLAEDRARTREDVDYRQKLYRYQGIPLNYNPERGFRFMRYYHLSSAGLSPETVFFHCSKANISSDHVFLDSAHIFEFSVVRSSDNSS